MARTWKSGRLPYLSGVDGLRAVAVCAVLVYHADPRLLPGGFLGVDVFFVISGFLITALLAGEWRCEGAVDLRAFWLRRARRLLPALYVLLFAVLAYAVVFLPGEVAALRDDALAALAYVANWYFVFEQRSYFEAAGRPPRCATCGRWRSRSSSTCCGRCCWRPGCAGCPGRRCSCSWSEGRPVREHSLVVRADD